MHRQTFGFKDSYKQIYRFFREKWDIDKVRRLRRVIQDYLRSADELEQRLSFNKMWSDMRAAVTAMEEVNLK